MAADSLDKPSSSIPWPTLVLLVASTGGALLLLPPLQSDRPNVGSSKAQTTIGDNDFDARLWQDPFKAAADHISSLPKDWFAPAHPAHRLPSLTKQLHDRNISSKTLVLAVMVHAAPYAEYVEDRLRCRQALLEALAVSNFLPDDGEHIGGVNIPWCEDRLSSLDSCRSGKLNAHQQDRLMPYEWCTYQNLHVNQRPSHASDSSPKLSPQFKSVLVLWLPDEAFGDIPLSRLAKLFELLKVDLNDPCGPVVKIIGPRSSSTLRQMILDADHPTQEIAALGKAVIYSASATAADDLLLDDSINEAHATNVEDFFRWQLGIAIHRSIPNDELVLTEMIDELERRQVHVRKRRDEAAQNHIAIISELDTFYGLAIPLSFAKVAGITPSHSLSLEGLDKDAPWIHTFRYLRGIDGKLPGETSDGDNSVSASGTSTPDDATKRGAKNSYKRALEDSEGLNQADYLRRLANNLQETDRVLARSTGEGIRAVGILGTDLYDKLLILRAIRDRLPGAVFFTTNLDARFTQQSEWSATHNLVIASGFGLSLNPYYQHEIPPFRDSYQTALFAAGLKITGILPQDVLYGRPRLYEIARSGAHDLSFVAPPLPDGSGDNPEYEKAFDANFAKVYANPPLTLQPPRNDLAGWWTSRRFDAVAVIASTAAACLITLGSLTGWPRGLDLSKLVTLTLPWIILSLATTVILLWLVVRWQILEGVPFALFDGISIWPTEAARFFVGLLCFHLLIKAPLDIEKST